MQRFQFALPARRRLAAAMLVAAALTGLGATVAHAADRFFRTSDGVRLHYIDAGAPGAPTIVLVPGWTMPAWIWESQITYFSRHFHVVAFDPRGQGESDIAADGYEPDRRGNDIAELIENLHAGRVLLVGWSLGVLDSLAYLHLHGDAAIAGLVLVDNSVGENPPPGASAGPAHRAPSRPLSREAKMRVFVRGMFRRAQPAPWLDRLTAACLRTPQRAAEQLLAYPVPRTYWREAVYSTHKPLLYVVRPRFSGQAANLAANAPNAQTAIFTDAGHALFVDDAARFNALLEAFIRGKVWR